MTIRTFARFLSSLLTVDDDGETYPPLWTTDDLTSVLIDNDTGRLLAQIWEFGPGEYYVTLFVSAKCALRLFDNYPNCELSLASFPRIAVYLPPMKSASRAAAERAVLHLLGRAFSYPVPEEELPF